MPRIATQAELLADPAIVPNNDVWTESDTAVMSANGLLFYYREGNGLLPYASLPILGPSVAPGSCFPARPSVSRCPPACSVIASISIAELVECVEGLGRLPALQDAICEGSEECPTECEVIEGMESPALVACIPSDNRTDVLCVLMQQPEITPEALVVCADGAGLTAALQALICAPVTIQLQDSAANPIGAPDVYAPGTTTTKTAPDGTIRTTDGLTPVGAVLSNGTFDLQQSVIKYIDAAGAAQVTAASDTEYSGGTLRPAAVVPRRQVLNTAGNPANATYADLDDLVAGTLPIAQDGTVTINNSVPTLLHTVPVVSNGAATQAIADSTITKPDATTEGLPATVALDVRDYRSGIAYQFGGSAWSGQSASYRTGDEGDLWASGWFGYTPPVYPLSFARLGADRVTLAENNIHGNTDRFTDRSGGQTYSDDIVQDHLTGTEWYRVLQSAATWNDAIDGAIALSVGG
jgi:hypothetical protein